MRWLSTYLTMVDSHAQGSNAIKSSHPSDKRTLFFSRKNKIKNQISEWTLSCIFLLQGSKLSLLVFWQQECGIRMLYFSMVEDSSKSQLLQFEVGEDH